MMIAYGADSTSAVDRAVRTRSLQLSIVAREVPGSSRHDTASPVARAGDDNDVRSRPDMAAFVAPMLYHRDP